VSLLDRTRQRGPQWVYAGKVALGATAIVGVVAVLLALAANLVIVNHLEQAADARLAARLTSASHGPVDPLSTVSAAPRSGDLDDAPTFLWSVGPDGVARSLTLGAPPLAVRLWAVGPVTLTTAGSPFRFDTVGTSHGWLVAGESVGRIGEVRDQLLIAEAVLGVLLLAVTFAGSFLVGLRASAPIEQIRRRQAEFTADASHELRTPLSVIEAEVDLALGRERDAVSYQDTLRRVSSESARLRSIVEDLLWLARADADPAGVRTDQLVDVAEVGGSCLSRFRAVADAASVTLTGRIDGPGAAPIRADADSVDRLISVLLDNACRYAGAGGTVDLAVGLQAGRVVLTVDDSGPGIPEDHQDLVFDRFHRADATPGGTGLGLAIADAVVRSSGGTWSVGTSPAGGARMEVSWRPASAGSPRPVPQTVP
jgi:signal transduction histidine kinase